MVIDGVDEPVGPDGPQRVGRTAPLPHVAQALREPGPDAAPALGQRDDAVRAELRGAEPQGQRRRDGQQDGGGEEQQRVRRAEQPQDEGDAGADAVRRGAGRRRQGVGRDQILGGDDVGQSGRQPGQQEPVDADAGQDRDVQRPAVAPTAAASRATPTAPTARSAVADEQHLAPAPAVEQHADEGADQGERQQQHGEGRRHPARRALLLGVEEEQAGQRDLEDAVAALAGEPHREQPTEARSRAPADAGRGSGSRRKARRHPLGGQFSVGNGEHAAPPDGGGSGVSVVSDAELSESGGRASALELAADERLEVGPAEVVRRLHRRGLHQVRRRRRGSGRRCRGPWRSSPRGGRR